MKGLLGYQNGTLRQVVNNQVQFRSDQEIESLRVPFALRKTSAPFLLATAAIVVHPASRPLGAAISLLGVILLVSQPIFKKAVIHFGVLASFLLITYGVFKGEVITASIDGMMAAVLVLSVGSLESGRREDAGNLVLICLWAYLEVFLYANVMGLVVGVEGVNENRLFLFATTGAERLSFPFGSPTHAAMGGGVAVLLAVAAGDRVRASRRVILGGVAVFVLIGANYRFIQGFALVVVLVWWWARIRSRTFGRRRVRDGACLRYALASIAVVSLATPLWWPPLFSTVGEPIVTAVAATPGLGMRNQALADREEVATLNRRTELWQLNYELFGRASARETLVGFGERGGDAEYRGEIRRVLSRGFVDLDPISSHNTVLEWMRRGGVVTVVSLASLILVLLIRLFRWQQTLALVAVSFVLGAGGTEISVVPEISLPAVIVLIAAATAVSERHTVAAAEKQE